ncbi:MAG: nitronate monooxygenase [Spirochaetales bacterium]|nr:nitronate monooxygenase [Spirochaetales bacterium]
MKSTSLSTILNRIKEEVQACKAYLPIERTIQRILGSRTTWPALKIGDLVASTPIVQGGMGVGISLSSLASAVANNGGIGVIAANGIGLLEPDYYEDGQAANLRAFRREIRKARELSSGVIGVNIMVAVNDFHQLLDVAIEEKVDIVFMGAGLPIKNMPVQALRKANVKVAPIVSSARAVDMIFRMWTKLYNDTPDAVVFEGPKAGGHLGFSEEQLEDPAYQLEAIVPQIAEALKPYEESKGCKIPLIAGGGVYSGRDVYKVLSLGASAVQMATRFVATEECDADIRFKQAYVDCTKEQIGLIKSPVGMPGRAIRNTFITDSEEGKRPAFRCAWKCLASCKAQDANYCISIALNNARRGLLQSGFVFTGTNGYRIKKIVPVKSLVAELERGYQKAVQMNLERVLAKLSILKTEYVKAETQVKELARRYEEALLTLPLKSEMLKAIRTQYNRAALQVEHLKLKMTETLATTSLLLS